MTSGSTREFMALCAIAQHFGRPGTPTDQAWIESFNGHLKAEYPHLERITDTAVLRAELDVIRPQWDGVRLHAGIGYVTPDDEHEGRGPAIRKAREAGLESARLRRITYHRNRHQQQPDRGPDDVGLIETASLSRSQKRVSAAVRNSPKSPVRVAPLGARRSAILAFGCARGACEGTCAAARPIARSAITPDVSTARCHT